MNRARIVEMVGKYYTEKIIEHGAVPKGVDWNGDESQMLRFDQLLRLIDSPNTNFTLLDYGCGYGALYSFLAKQNVEYTYTGYDISDEMIQAARRIHPTSGVQWSSNEEDLKLYDYVIASGIFNVKGLIADSDWEQYILDTLLRMNKVSIKGFAFNVLTDYSDPEKTKPNLYYANPARLFDLCKSKFSKSVALLHDYPLYEFTILVRKAIL